MFQDLVKLIRSKGKEILVLFADSGLSNVGLWHEDMERTPHELVICF